jgi:lycopene cyclase domain-containing protein
MNYLAFLLIFLVPPIAVLIVVLFRRLSRRQCRTLALIIALAVAYTAPWDNALVRTGVWSFAPARTLHIAIGVVPAEEYIFYALQVVLTGLLTIWLLQRPPPHD